MTIEVVIITVLCAILGLQQGFYMWQVQKLINKLMSRDFASYQHTASPPKTQGFTVQLPDEGFDRVKELNRLHNMPTM